MVIRLQNKNGILFAFGKNGDVNEYADEEGKLKCRETHKIKEAHDITVAEVLAPNWFALGGEHGVIWIYKDGVTKRIVRGIGKVQSILLIQEVYLISFNDGEVWMVGRDSLETVRVLKIVKEGEILDKSQNTLRTFKLALSQDSLIYSGDHGQLHSLHLQGDILEVLTQEYFSSQSHLF